LEEQLVKRNEAAILLEEQKNEQEEKIRQLEASKAQVEQALQAQQKVTISAIERERCYI
jgi:methylphosphotriester-DNA--protein-cysteine methyltransferase